MKIFVGADHRGFNYKKKILQILNKQGFDAVDMGAFSPDRYSDYPKIAYKVASKVAKSRNDRGILICMSGLGQVIAANKIKGAYAALCYNTKSARLSRKHNDANVLVLSSMFVKFKEVEKMLRVWLTTEFEGGRHRRRIHQIKAIEKGKKFK